MNPTGPQSGPQDVARSIALVGEQRRVLEHMAQGTPTEGLLGSLCKFVETHAPGALCSVLILSEDQRTLRHGHGSSLPSAYCEVVDGSPIGPKAGSCGTAAFENREVVVEDIATNPLWADYKEIALLHGLKACASLPIRGPKGNVLGTFALYHREPGPFSSMEMELLESVLGLAAIVLRNDKRESALRKSEERLKLTLESTQDGFWDWDIQNDTVHYSDHWYRMLGFEPGEIQDEMKTWQSIVHPEDEAQVMTAVQDHLEGRRSFIEAEQRCRTKDGRWIWLLVRGRVVAWDDRGRPLRATGTHTDITRSKVIEEELRDREAQLSEAQRIAKIGGWDLDIVNHAVQWSDETCRIFGLVPGTFMPSSEVFFKAVHPEDLDRVREEELQSILGLRPFQTEFRVIRPDGEVRWVYEEAETQYDENGKPTTLVGICQDITDRKRDEYRARKGEARYRAVVEQAGDMIFLFDTETKQIVESNRAFRQTLGYTDEDMASLNLYDLVDSDRATVDFNVALVVSEQQFTVGRRRYRRKDGQFCDVEVSANFIREIGQDLLCAVARDVTDQIRVESAMRQAQKLESLGVLAGGIAHDFNNLLTAILGNLNLAQMNLSPASPVMPYLSKIEGTVLRAADLTRQMLAYSGKGRFVVQPLDLRHVIDEMTHLLEVSISKKVALHFHLPEGLPAIEADAAQIQQVVMNLVTNASESIGDREGAIRLSADTALIDEGYIQRHLLGQAVSPGKYVIFQVSDTGSGMSAETIARIFDPFFTTKISGRGLGLSAMLGILKGHKAGINIYSELDRGSTFKIYFPARVAAATEPVAAEPKARAVLPLGTALVVDDESAIRTTAAAMLESLGFKVIEASDGVEAVAQYTANQAHINLVLMDLTMPRMDGKDAFRALRDLNPDVKVILSSGYNQQEAVQKLIGRGRAEFLQKPYQFKDLRAALEKILL